MTRKLDYRWNLRQVMAARGMFATTDLIGPLADREIKLSSSQVYRLVTERPERLSLKVLMALLDILECTMEDLIEPVGRRETGPEGENRERRRGRRRGPAAPKSPDRRHEGGNSDSRDQPGSAGSPGRGHRGPDRRTGTRPGPRRDRQGDGGRGRAAGPSAAGWRQALLDNPAVLADGRSPAPRAVADLLFPCAGPARRTSRRRPAPGAASLCARYQRRGEDWYCSVCGRGPGTVLGLRPGPARLQPRPGRDSPRCAQCPASDGATRSP